MCEDRNLPCVRTCHATLLEFLYTHTSQTAREYAVVWLHRRCCIYDAAGLHMPEQASVSPANSEAAHESTHEREQRHRQETFEMQQRHKREIWELQKRHSLETQIWQLRQRHNLDISTYPAV